MKYLAACSDVLLCDEQLSPIERIRYLVSRSNDPMLDKAPYSENNIFEILWMLVGENKEKPCYADVPVWTICAFTHLNCSYHGTTWRNLLYPTPDAKRSGVTGKGWAQDVFNYFSSPLKDNWFPAESSTDELRLHAYGNVVSVTNGVHRAIGGINYLVAVEGSESAILKEASLTYQSVDRELLDLLRKVSINNTDIWLSWSRYRDRRAGINVMAVNKFGAKVFFYQKNKAVLKNNWLPYARCIIDFGRKVRLFQQWHPLAKEHLRVLLKDDWLTKSIH